MSERKNVVLDKHTVIDGDLRCGNITCLAGKKYSLMVNGNLDCYEINVKDIMARNLKAWNIKAEKINAWNIEAGDINAKNIEAREITYFAVCFAYNNIICTSIKGEFIKAKHFVLGGKITIYNKGA